MVTTSDPVSLVEIAARCGVNRERVAGWKKRGALPTPDWVVGRTSLWAWETLRAVPLVAQHLEDADVTKVWAELFEAIEDRDELYMLTVPDSEWAELSRRIERAMHGAVNVPCGGSRLVVSTYQVGGEVGLESARAALVAACDQHRRERAEATGVGGVPTPLVSLIWRQAN